MSERGEQSLVQQLVTQSAVEALNEGVLRRLACPISMPSLSSSPWIRGTPHSGLAMLISRISQRNSDGTVGLPPWRRAVGSNRVSGAILRKTGLLPKLRGDFRQRVETNQKNWARRDFRVRPETRQRPACAPLEAENLECRHGLGWRGSVDGPLLCPFSLLTGN
jgi:hypothetical protein